jgi:cell division septal protein FtsQ
VKRAQRRTISAGARLRPFWFIGLLLAAIAVASLYFGATWQGFYPKRVTVTGNRTVSSQEIASAAGIARNANVWLQNMSAARARIARIPYVHEVWIHRSLPANVAIVVRERVPYAVVAYGPRLLAVDNSLRVLQAAPRSWVLPVLVSNAERAPQPGYFIKDDALSRLLHDAQTLAAAHVAVRRLWYDKFGDLAALMPGGVRLLLGDDGDLAAKSRLIGPILSQAGAGGRRIGAVDLRAAKTPIVVYR